MTIETVNPLAPCSKVLAMVGLVFSIATLACSNGGTIDEPLVKHVLNSERTCNDASGVQYCEYYVSGYSNKVGIRIFWIEFESAMYQPSLIAVHDQWAAIDDPLSGDSKAVAYLTGGKFSDRGCYSDGFLKAGGVVRSRRHPRQTGGLLIVDATGDVEIVRVKDFKDDEAYVDVLQETPLLVYRGKVDEPLRKGPLGRKLAIGLTGEGNFIVAGAYGGKLNQHEFAQFLASDKTSGGPGVTAALQLESFQFNVEVPIVSLSLRERLMSSTCVANVILIRRVAGDDTD